MLRPCPSCRRHVAAEPACPFCGVPLPEPAAPRPLVAGRFSRAAVFAGATLAGCWTGSNEPRTTPDPHHEATDKTATDPAMTKAGSVEGTLTDSATGQTASGLRVRLTAEGKKPLE